MKRFLVVLCLIFLFKVSFIGQNNNVDSTRKKVEFSGYLENYYGYDFNNPALGNRPSFFYSFNRHNEFNVNLGYVKVAFSEDRIKGSFGLMAGTYVNSNLAHEPTTLKNVLEANIGYRLIKDRETWITAGVFSSHLGFESAVGADCWNLTRSILAENSPYYLSGVKLYHTSVNNKWTYGITAANGWQRIQRIAGNQEIGLGHQVTFTPNEDLILNSSSYFGSEFPDSVRRVRYFHDFYTIINETKRLSFILGFDIGFEQKSKNSNSYSRWLAPIILAKYKVTNQLSLAGRLEYYEDKDGVIISTLNTGIATLGYSFNLDYAISKRLLARLEYRSLTDQNAIYRTPNGIINTNHMLATSLSLRF